MNFYAEIRAFYDWLPFNDKCTADAQALWFSLMYLNNKCAIKINNEWYWRVEFTVSNPTLLSMLKFSRQQLDRMRNVLMQIGRIEYKKGRGSQAGTYKMIPFEAHNVTQTVTQYDTQTVTQVWSQTGHLCNNKSTLINNNNIYNNTMSGVVVDINNNIYNAREGEPKSPDPLEAYFGLTENIKTELKIYSSTLFLKYFGRTPTPMDDTMVLEKIKNMGQVTETISLSEERKEVLEYAFGEAQKSGNTSWQYVNGIYTNMVQRGLKTIDDCISFDYERDKLMGRI